MNNKFYWILIRIYNYYKLYNIIELLTNEELEILSTNFILENLPTQQGISDLILEQKKANLLSQYMWWISYTQILYDKLL